MIPEFKTFLPAAQEFTLPSRGLYYDNKLPGGVIHIRPMTISEEKILATERLAKSGDALNLVFEACITQKFPIRDYLTADKAAILLWLRAASYGADYNIEVSCPHCRAKNGKLVNLESDLNVRYADPSDADLLEPFTVHLPKCDKNIQFILPRSFHEDALVRLKQQQDALYAKNKGKKAVDNTLTDRLKMLIKSVDGVDPAFIGMWLDSLTAYDASILKEAINKDRFGIDTELAFSCDSCGENFTADMPITKDFFRVNS